MCIIGIPEGEGSEVDGSSISQDQRFSNNDKIKQDKCKNLWLQEIRSLCMNNVVYLPFIHLLLNFLSYYLVFSMYEQCSLLAENQVIREKI
jgi:hypothetical protein